MKVNPPRIVYAGPLEDSGTCLSRLNALREIEPDVFAFDTQPYFNSKSIWNRFDRRFTYAGTEFRTANRDFLAHCDKAKPDIVWIDKGWWLWPSTLNTLRERGIFRVQHNTDKLRPKTWSAQSVYKLLRKGLSLYHLYFTSNLPDFEALSISKNPRTELTHLGFDPSRFNAAPLSAELAGKWAADLLFVGHYEPRTERYILALIDAGLNATVYGYGWDRARYRERLGRHVRHTMLNARDYEHALKAATLGLCFVSEWNGNHTSGRSFEIPASGTFMLAMRSVQHLESFKEGEEAEFFGNEQELVEKAKYYLEHSDKRRAIAARGNERCTRSDYSWTRYMREDWAKVRAHFADFKGQPS